MIFFHHLTSLLLLPLMSPLPCTYYHHHHPQPLLRELFVEYSKNCYCEESCFFLLEVLKFQHLAHAITSHADIINSSHLCEAIINDYILRGAIYEVNISSSMKDNTIHKAKEYVSWCRDSCFTLSLPPMPLGKTKSKNSFRLKVIPIKIPRRDSTKQPAEVRRRRRREEEEKGGVGESRNSRNFPCSI